MTTACGATVNRLSFRPADGGFLYTHQEAATIQYNIDNNANLTQTDKKFTLIRKRQPFNTTLIITLTSPRQIRNSTKKP
jgi:hypothetical protein